MRDPRAGFANDMTDDGLGSRHQEDKRAGLGIGLVVEECIECALIGKTVVVALRAGGRC